MFIDMARASKSKAVPIPGQPQELRFLPERVLTDDESRGATLRHVAVLIETSGSYGRGLLRGVSRYNSAHGGWSTYFLPHGLGDALPQWLKSWRGDGILARIQTPDIAQSLLDGGVPVVNLRSFEGQPFPYVGPDHAAIGQMAAEHLLERGLKHFAFYGRPVGVHPGLDERGVTFRATVEAAGGDCSTITALPGKRRNSWEDDQERLSRWIAKLPKPVGIMAANDELGLGVLDACRRCGAAVPDEAAVIGVDNDEYLCDLAIPPMTSIDVNAEQIGHTAAQMLDALMQHPGRSAAAERFPSRLPPRGVVTRLSTDVVASDDEDVNRAIRFIREHGHRNLTVSDVLNHVGVSRATLQARMKRVVGRTIHEEIERSRIERVKELLLQQDLTIKQVARLTGFSSVQYLTRVFRKTLGETPARYSSRRRS